MRERLFFIISKRHRVQRVGDDYPGYFATYRRFGVPERIGLLRPRRYIERIYKRFLEEHQSILLTGNITVL